MTVDDLYVSFSLALSISDDPEIIGYNTPKFQMKPPHWLCLKGRSLGPGASPKRDLGCTGSQTSSTHGSPLIGSKAQLDVKRDQGF